MVPDLNYGEKTSGQAKRSTAFDVGVDRTRLDRKRFEQAESRRNSDRCGAAGAQEIRVGQGARTPLAVSPTERLIAARTECRSTQLGPRSAAGRLLDVGGTAADAAQSRSRDHRAEADEPSPPTPTHAIRVRSVRCF